MYCPGGTRKPGVFPERLGADGCSQPSLERGAVIRGASVGLSTVELRILAELEAQFSRHGGWRGLLASVLLLAINGYLFILSGRWGSVPLMIATVLLFPLVLLPPQWSRLRQAWRCSPRRTSVNRRID